MARKPKTPNTVEILEHEEASRKNIPTAEHQSVRRKEQQDPVPAIYKRRNRDLDPQFVWRGKDEQDWSDLVVYSVSRKGSTFPRNAPSAVGYQPSARTGSRPSKARTARGR